MAHFETKHLSLSRGQTTSATPYPASHYTICQATMTALTCTNLMQIFDETLRYQSENNTKKPQCPITLARYIPEVLRHQLCWVLRC
ncbi:hypothetical protein AVEN_194889-1 [Araneus ventricosus]|uniref:Uncharacterized protein n=1 Tax=Araneus ventricosus TaxID=182803 RepID=A0A4Y2B2U8_ARAVE|nr:hypothetical protein AVEN_194889-1 [Araneus ventricosus]